MSKSHSDKGRYDGKYGERTVSWDNTQSDESFVQHNVKDADTGDHHFTNTRTGVMGTALGNYRPYRDNNGGDKK